MKPTTPGARIEAVLRGYPGQGTAKLVLIGIASHDGAGGAYPSIDTLATYASVDRRNARRAVATLTETGWLEVVANAGGDRHTRDDHRPNLYVVDYDRLVDAITESERGGASIPPSDGDGGAPASATGGRERPDGGADAPPEQDGNRTEEQDTPHGVAVATPGVEELCSHLADRIEAFHPTRARPPITAKWRKDMRLLLERGPLRDEHAAPMTPARVRASIDAVFDQLAEPTGRDGFCWAAQIRSPHALRDHWVQLATAFHRLGAAATTPRMRRLASRPGGLRAFAEAAGYDVNDPNSPLALPQERTS